MRVAPGAADPSAAPAAPPASAAAAGGSAAADEAPAPAAAAVAAAAAAEAAQPPPPLTEAQQHALRFLQVLLGKLRAQDTNGYFTLPVDANLVPGYYDKIAQPMWFRRMEEKLSNREYRTWRRFTDDFELIFSNARTFNLPKSKVYRLAQMLQRTGRKLLQSAELEARKCIYALHPEGPAVAAAEEAADLLRYAGEPRKEDADDGPQDTSTMDEDGQAGDATAGEAADATAGGEGTAAGRAAAGGARDKDTLWQQNVLQLLDSDAGAIFVRRKESGVDRVLDRVKIPAAAQPWPAAAGRPSGADSSRPASGRASAGSPGRQRLAARARWLELRVRELEHVGGLLRQAVRGGSDEQLTDKERDTATSGTPPELNAVQLNARGVLGGRLQQLLPLQLIQQVPFFADQLPLPVIATAPPPAAAAATAASPVAIPTAPPGDVAPATATASATSPCAAAAPAAHARHPEDDIFVPARVYAALSVLEERLGAVRARLCEVYAIEDPLKPLLARSVSQQQQQQQQQLQAAHGLGKRPKRGGGRWGTSSLSRAESLGQAKKRRRSDTDDAPLFSPSMSSFRSLDRQVSVIAIPQVRELPPLEVAARYAAVTAWNKGMRQQGYQAPMPPEVAAVLAQDQGDEDEDEPHHNGNGAAAASSSSSEDTSDAVYAHMHAVMEAEERLRYQAMAAADRKRPAATTPHLGAQGNPAPLGKPMPPMPQLPSVLQRAGVATAASHLAATAGSLGYHHNTVTARSAPAMLNTLDVKVSRAEPSPNAGEITTRSGRIATRPNTRADASTEEDSESDSDDGGGRRRSRGRGGRSRGRSYARGSPERHGSSRRSPGSRSVPRGREAAATNGRRPPLPTSRSTSRIKGRGNSR